MLLHQLVHARRSQSHLAARHDVVCPLRRGGTGGMLGGGELKRAVVLDESLPTLRCGSGGPLLPTAPSGVTDASVPKVEKAAAALALEAGSTVGA